LSALSVNDRLLDAEAEETGDMPDG